MALSCICRDPCTKEFTVLLVHVLHVSHPSALEGSTVYARELVDRFFERHTHIEVSHIDPHDHKFRHLNAESRLEIAFAWRPKGFKAPSYKIYKYEHSEGLAVVFEVETRLIKCYIPPHCDFDLLEIERTDYVPLTGCAHRQVEDIRVSHMNVWNG